MPPLTVSYSEGLFDACVRAVLTEGRQVAAAIPHLRAAGAAELEIGANVDAFEAALVAWQDGLDDLRQRLAWQLTDPQRVADWRSKAEALKMAERAYLKGEEADEESDDPPGDPTNN